ncbi:site-specific DNA-methyltransferase [Euhalothece natronophila Z-M001]|uniref:Methyltransferase n=1 Tax=Euhalothece natronophila Z-M001 TaxID=522448 RepID=A0A5B8NNR5_9CHRO|nr:site-specific DNA-methyltransferase [Euhalothece natronophila]QDZ40708.1 site-specific DNA-methyltransferase [Euhalothece natronophila Z-M001]
MKRASRNRTLSCDQDEINYFRKKLLVANSPKSLALLKNQILCQDFFDAIQYFPQESIDLLILDPPYNLSKNYHGNHFQEKDKSNYTKWFNQVISNLRPLLKPKATIYVCSDWKTSILIAPILEQYFWIQNRITWEREKGRGAKRNWKNNTEDIWFCTLSKDYTFNIEAVKLKKKVIAPYRKADGSPKDWQAEKDGNFRLTHPSNIWTDITIPFWSMPENTDHPTQKPEKLIAKLILASSKEQEVVFDPFLGSGTTAVVAKKLNRHFIGIEINQEYCCWAMKRLQQAKADASIQGYSQGIFWERNS